VRVFNSWISGWMDFTKGLSTPTLFRKWTAIAAIAGALERKVWLKIQGNYLYPGCYIIFVAPPGVGKTIVTSRVRALWNELDDQHLASVSLTKAALIDDLRDASRNIIRPQEIPSVVSFNSLKIVANELGVLIPTYEYEFMNVMTDLWDGHPYSERRRTKDLNFKIEAPQINLVAGTTPSYLTHVLPEGAWDQGFLARTMLIYSGEVILQPLFDDIAFSNEDWKHLVTDLKHIGALYGKMTFAPNAAALINNWHMSGGEPRPEHPKLANYNIRRTVHLLKLCMIASVADSNELVITLTHAQQALDWLLEAEHHMQDIFKAMTSGGDIKVIEETWYYAYKMFMQTQVPIPEHELVLFIQERTPAHNVGRILEVMVRSKILTMTELNKIGKAYTPRPPKR